METTKFGIIDFLSEHNIIQIPCWHREYVWTSAYINQFFDDVESLINNTGTISHFFGTIIYEELEQPFFSVRITDGQQRIVTVSLFLNALFNHFKEYKYKDILLYQGSKNKKTKLQNASSIQELYENLLDDEAFAYMNNSTYSQAYRVLTDRIENCKYNLNNYLEAIQKFQIICIALNKQDNAQLIFDSINSVSMRLTKFEKIKNYIFMGLEKDSSNNIVDEYWLPLVQLFSDNAENFITYLIAYVSMQTGRKVNQDNIFTEFNKFYTYKKKFKPAKEIIGEIFKFAQYYNRIKNIDFSHEIAIVLEKLITLADSPEIFAFLFELIDDFQNNLIPQKSFTDILESMYNQVKMYVDNEQEIDFANLSQTISKLLTQVDE